MSIRIFAFLVAAVAGLVAAPALAIDQVEPTPEQKARCEGAQRESGKRFCLAGYSVRGLDFPTTAQEVAPNSVRSMAIYKPPGTGPFPAIILLHTCATLDLNDQLAYWVRAALASGYVAFVLDQFTQRGIYGNEGGCGEAWPGWRNKDAGRTRDAFDALAHLGRFDFVDTTRIAAMGFSEGARATYYLSSRGVGKLFATDGRFAAVVALYGQCYIASTGISRIASDIATPLLALLGEVDVDGDPKHCVPRLQTAKDGGAPIEWTVFPKTGHVWDQPSRIPGQRMSWHEPPFTVLFEYNRDVTERSRDLAFAFLQRVMK
ncbi:MAG: putative carboxymethylenebutenolidase [Rhodospirillales bacterium]|jgi:dienelactone hydrolase|nr:putative carboxymethylenebutenolidase [Rhodospirillales bacterium]